MRHASWLYHKERTWTSTIHSILTIVVVCVGVCGTEQGSRAWEGLHMAQDRPKWIMRMNRARLGVMLLPAFLCLSVSALASPQIDVSLGFSGYFVPARMAPLRVSLSGLEPAFSGSVRIVEQVGNAWRGQARSSICLPISGASRVYEGAIPVYDFSQPLRVSLLGEDGQVIAQREVALRDKWREEPFIVAVGDFPAPVTQDAIQVDETHLPTKWLSYEGVRSLWIGRTVSGLTAAQEEAIYRWTSAGGITVIFTGRDFFRLDSPLVRDIIPFTNPRIADGKDLVGDLRPGAEVVLRGSTGEPLLVSHRLGAGLVLLVTLDVFSLSEAQHTQLADLVPSAALVDLSDVTASMLQQMPLTRPGYTTAIVIVAVLLTALVVIFSREHSDLRRVTFLLVVVIGCSLWSGFYANRAKALYDIYTIKTSLSVQKVLGYTVDCYGLTHLGSGIDSALPKVRVRDSILQSLPRDLNERSYDIDLLCNHDAVVGISPGDIRILRGGSDNSPLISMSFSGDERVVINNSLGFILPYAAMILDGTTFLLEPISTGVHAYSLSREAEAFAPGIRELSSVYAAVRRYYDLPNGIWLVAGTITDSTVDGGDYRQKVRDVKLILVEGER